MKKSLIAANRLARIVRKYESYTFSASAARITERQVDLVVALLIDKIQFHLDGDQIASRLDIVRRRP